MVEQDEIGDYRFLVEDIFSTFAFTASSILMSCGRARFKPSLGIFFVTWLFGCSLSANYLVTGGG